MRWYVPLDNAVHLIGWGEPCYLDVVREPSLVMRVFTIESIDDETGDVEPRRPVAVFATEDDLPEICEYIGSATAPGEYNPKVMHLVAVDEGAGPSPDDGEVFSTSVTVPEGTLIASIVADPKSGRDYNSILSLGIEHMRSLLASQEDY